MFNWPRASRLPGVSHWFMRFPGIPAVICSAGPSLDAALEYLKPLQRRFLIMCVDNAYKRVTAAGIRPDVTLTVDAQPTVTDMFSTYCRGDLVAWCPFQDYGLYLKIGGDNLVCYTEEMEVNPIWTDIQNEYFNKKINPRWGSLAAGGTVSTIAVSLAFLMHCNPIIHVGLDLAYYSLESAQATESAFSELTDMHGNTVWTIGPFWLSKLWYEDAVRNWMETKTQKNTRTWVNATGRGILDTGHILTGPGALERYAGIPMNHAHYLRQYLARKPLVTNAPATPRAIPIRLKPHEATMRGIR